MSSEETDQLQDEQHRVQLARHLFIEQGEFVRSVVGYLTSNDEHADDLVHDLFLFFVAKPIPKDILNIRGYLYKVILDRVRDWQRARIRYHKKIWKYGEINIKRFTALYQNQKSEPHKDTQKILEFIEKHLSKTEVKAILLRYQNQYAIEDVAREMNIKPRSASRYISVGLKKIRDLLKTSEGADHEEGK